MLGKKMSSASNSKSRGSNSALGRPGGKGQNGIPAFNHDLVGKASSSTAPCSSSPPSSLPHIRTSDNAKVLPKIHAALQRPADESVSTEDLDAIQMELEMLLCTVALRSRALKADYEAIVDKSSSDDQQRRNSNNEKKGKFMDNRQPTSPGKRKRVDEKKKDGKYGGNQAKMAKLKMNNNNNNMFMNPVQSPAPSSHNTDDSMDAQLQQRDNPKLTLHRNDTPNKFWLSVEPYCMPLTQEDIKLLDDLLEEYTGPLIPPIVDLGPHYSSVWAAEDLKDEQQEHLNATIKAGSKAKTSTFASNLMKQSQKIMGENVTGPLTQRLVSALMDENLMPADSLDSNSGSENTSSDLTSHRSSFAPMRNGICIERRVRKELIEQGILDAEDGLKEEDDEILSEIKRVRTELSAIADYNSSELKKLYGVAKEEMKRLEVKRKLDTIDQEIIETYKRIAAAKQKKRPLSKQERDEVFRLTEEQKRLSDILESMPFPGLTN